MHFLGRTLVAEPKRGWR